MFVLVYTAVRVGLLPQNPNYLRPHGVHCEDLTLDYRRYGCLSDHSQTLSNIIYDDFSPANNELLIT
ncbi:hypothetical protein, partial [Halorubrum sp. SD626R]|uniref:hypothetical protein n=1 Tax=Halorubrum sp. SD626R TaxID=1419722 RepID=UPI0037445992